ncbi:MAG: porin [Rhodobacteraceae bacterium]|nr:porin [Paracoccaceae bacterium]
MKTILLASVSAFAFAGAAAAEVNLSGDATLGYNDNSGSYWDATVAVGFSQELDNGLTFAGSINFDIVDGNQGFIVGASDYEISLTTDTAGLYFGDIDTATDVAFSTPDGMSVGLSDDFSYYVPNADPLLAGTWNDADAGIRGEVTFGGVSAYLSYGVNNNGDFTGLQVAATGTFGQFEVGFGYQDADHEDGEIFGVSAGAMFAGADIDLAYTSSDAEDSIGVGVSYGFGAVTVGGYYASNSVSFDEAGVDVAYSSGAISVAAYFDIVISDDDAIENASTFGVDASYDVGNGLTVLVGADSSDAGGDDYYVAATYDLGGGAEILVSYGVDDDNSADNEIGDPEYLAGATVEVSFSF